MDSKRAWSHPYIIKCGIRRPRYDLHPYSIAQRRPEPRSAVGDSGGGRADPVGRGVARKSPEPNSRSPTREPSSSHQSSATPVGQQLPSSAVEPSRRPQGGHDGWVVVLERLQPHQIPPEENEATKLNGAGAADPEQVVTEPADLAQESFSIVKQGAKKFDLKALYDWLNERVFGGQLPADLPVEWNTRLRTSNGTCATSGRAIGINERLFRRNPSRDRVLDALLHQMIHVKEGPVALEDENHSLWFASQVEALNARWHRRVVVDDWRDGDEYRRVAVERQLVHRWKCLAPGCDFQVGRSLNQRPGKHMTKEHRGKCWGKLKKMGKAETLAAIEKIIHGVEPTRADAEADDVDLTRADDEADDVDLTRGNAEADDVELTRADAKADDVNLTRGDAEADDVNLTRGDAEADDVNLTRGDAEADDVDLTRDDAEADDVDLTRGNAEADDVELTRADAKADDVDLTRADDEADDVDMKRGDAEADDVDLTRANAESDDGERNKVVDLTRDDTESDDQELIRGSDMPRRKRRKRPESSEDEDWRP